MFEATLKNLVEKVDGAQGAAVLNLDGLVIEAVGADGAPIDAGDAIAEYGRVARQLAEVNEAAEVGQLDQLTVEAEDRITCVRHLDEKYLAAIVVGADALVGKARFYLRIAAPDLAREL